MQQTIATSNTLVDIERQIEQDLAQHVEDTPLCGAIRNGKLVQLPWNALTDEEQHQARVNMFRPCDWEVA